MEMIEGHTCVCGGAPEVPPTCVHLLLLFVYKYLHPKRRGGIMKSPSGCKKGSLLLPLGVDMYVQREGSFLRPLCLHRAEGLECWMSCKACMWHRRGEAGTDLNPVK